jgi:PAS domain S-box-containing protein
MNAAGRNSDGRAVVSRRAMPDRAQFSKHQQALADFGAFSLRGEELDALLAEACRAVPEALGTKHAKVLELQPDGRHLLVRAGVGWDDGVVGQLLLPRDSRFQSGHALASGQPVVVQDAQSDSRFRVPAFMQQAHILASASVPILLPGGRAYGVLEVDATAAAAFSEDDVAFLRIYATLLGPVIDRLHKLGALRATEERFRLIVENALDYAIFLSDARDLITDWLPGAEAIFGWSAAEAVGQSGSILFTPEDREAQEDRKEFDLARREGVAPNRRWHIRKDGRRVFIDGSVTALRGDDGSLRGFLKIGQDVTERRKVEEQLRESEALQRALIEGMPQLVWRADSSGAWTWVGPQWTAYTGQSVEASRGMGWLQAVHPADREAFLAAWRSAASDGLLQADCRILHVGSGHYHWFQTRGMPVHGEAGRIIEWLGTSTDIDDQIRAREILAQSGAALEARVAERTAELEQALSRLHSEAQERQQAEMRLRQSEKLKAVGQLTGGIAHDLNNMLQGVTGGLSMIRARLQQERLADVPRHIDLANAAALRAAALVHRLLAFSRQQDLAPRPVNLSRIAREMADLVRRTVGPGVQVELQIADGQWLVLCDPNQLESALLNLCVNARDAMPEGGWLTISTEELVLSEAEVATHEDRLPGRYAAIAVSDTGTGMAPEVVARVFEPFFTTKPHGQGTGLGLSQIYGFVHQSGGLVQIETEPGKGTTVRLCLPYHMDDPHAVAAAVPGNRGTILLVEDEESVRELLAEHLRDHGFRVLEAESGSAALRLEQAGTHIDLLVSDYGLPGGMNGRQVVAAIRERRPDLPVILITGYANREQMSDLEVMRKPFDPMQLIERVVARLHLPR